MCSRVCPFFYDLAPSDFHLRAGRLGGSHISPKVRITMPDTLIAGGGVDAYTFLYTGRWSEGNCSESVISTHQGRMV